MPKQAVKDDWIIMLLSNIPVGHFVPELSRQLTKILKEEGTESELLRRFPVHPQYHYSPRLEETLSMLRLSGALSTWGPDYRDQVTQGMHNVANCRRELFSEEQKDYLKERASRLNHSPSY